MSTEPVVAFDGAAAPLQLIIDHTPAIVFAKDLEGRYIFANRQFERIAGVPRERVLGRTAPELFPPELAERFQRNDRRVLKKKRALEFEDVVEVGGVARTFLSSVFPLLGADGSPYAVCGILSDITGRKRVEGALQQAAFTVSGAGGAEVFNELARALSRILAVDAVLISVFADEGHTRMRTLATWLDDRILRSFDYELSSTPCAGVIGREFRFVAEGVNPEFAPGTMFGSLGFDAYAAYALNGADGRQLGLIAAMNRRPIRNPVLTEALLKIFAVRAAAEIERLRANEALRASEASYRAIFEASEDPIFVHDWASGAMLDVSPKATEVFGYSREELLRARIGDISSNEPPYTEAEAARLIEQAKAQDAPLRFEWRARHKDGHLMWHEVTLKRAAIAGEPRVLASIRDVTARKDADEALRASEAQYRAIFNASAELLVLRDENFRIVDVNPAYEAASGYSRDEVLGADRVIANPPETHRTLRQLHDRVLAGEPVQFDIQVLRRDGARLEIELRGLPVLHRGRPHVLWAGRDLTEAKRAEAARAELEAQLRQAQKMEAIGQLTGGIAHDFNNILTSVMGYMTLAAERPSALGDQRLGGYLEQAQTACRRARDLIQQMLTFSRGQRGEPRPVALAPLFADAARMLRSSLPATLELATDFAPGLPPVLLDPVQADQVLMNLCINARDAMNGKGRIRVELRRRRFDGASCAACHGRIGGDFVELAVADAGPGVPPQVQVRMFEPFFSTKEIGLGSGMGLSTVHGIVHQHGGHILVETALGGGTTFRVLFPALAGTCAEEPRPSAAGPVRARLSGRVLVVDDEAMVAAFMRELLENWGLEVTAKTDPLEAREAFARAPAQFDLVLTDQTMPRVTGLELAHAMRGIRSDARVILYSGYAEGISEAQIRDAGIAALIRKPVEPALLFAALEAHLPRAAAAADG